jgi:hypothetical protein
VEEAVNHIAGRALIVVFKNLCIHRVRDWTWKSEFLIKKLNLIGRDRKSSGTGFWTQFIYTPNAQIDLKIHEMKIFSLLEIRNNARMREMCVADFHIYALPL